MRESEKQYSLLYEISGERGNSDIVYVRDYGMYI